MYISLSQIHTRVTHTRTHVGEEKENENNQIGNVIIIIIRIIRRRIEANSST